MHIIRLPNGSEFSAPSDEILIEWAKQRRIPADALISAPGEPPVRADHHPLIAAMAVTPPTSQGTISDGMSEAPLGGLIPVNNSKALIGYYLGVAALIPCVGIFFGIASITLGIMGLRDYAKNPARKGRTHAIVAIVLGALSILGYGTLMIFMAMSK